MEDLLWGWLLRWELEEDCAAVVCVVGARWFAGGCDLVERVEVVEAELQDGLVVEMQVLEPGSRNEERICQRRQRRIRAGFRLSRARTCEWRFDSTAVHLDGWGVTNWSVEDGSRFEQDFKARRLASGGGLKAVTGSSMFSGTQACERRIQSDDWEMEAHAKAQWKKTVLEHSQGI